MIQSIQAALLCACLAACGALSCPDRRLSDADRESNDHERAYVLIAAGTGSGAPCERISPAAYQVDPEAERGLQIALTRSLCYASTAERTGDADFCTQVVSLSSFHHDGSKLDEARCRERATGRTPAVESPPNLDVLLLELAMPQQTGLDALKLIKTGTDNIRDIADTLALEYGKDQQQVARENVSASQFFDGLSITLHHAIQIYIICICNSHVERGHTTFDIQVLDYNVVTFSGNAVGTGLVQFFQ